MTCVYMLQHTRGCKHVCAVFMCVSLRPPNSAACQGHFPRAFNCVYLRGMCVCVSVSVRAHDDGSVARNPFHHLLLCQYTDDLTAIDTHTHIFDPLTGLHWKSAYQDSLVSVTS